MINNINIHMNNELYINEEICELVNIDEHAHYNYIIIMFPIFFFSCLAFSSLYFGKLFDVSSLLDNELKENNSDKEIDCNKENNCKKETEIKPILFENKYLEKFKSFPNEYKFTDIEQKMQEDMYNNIKQTYELNFNEKNTELQEKLLYLKQFLNENETDFTNYCNINKLKQIINSEYTIFDIYNNLKNRSECEDFYDFCYDEDDNIKETPVTKENIIFAFEKVNEKLKELTENKKKDDDFKLEALNYIINNKLDKFINNYVLEYTPLGNVYMRYNNDKKTFEYFSNNTIPYRYLEPIGRKYVMTYMCKPLFVDLEEELKQSEIRYEEKKRLEEEKRSNISKNIVKKDVLVKLKNYNKDTTKPIQSNMSMSKNRAQSNFVLPPQIKANLPNVNTQSDKQLLKENANRYTWEGRLSGFCPLKKIDNKIFDKKLAMSYADFKKLNKSKNA